MNEKCEILQNKNCSCVWLQLNLNQMIPPPHTQKEIIINTLRDSVKENLMIRRHKQSDFLRKLQKISIFWCFYGKKLQNFPKFAHFPKISLFPRNIPISQLFHTCETGDPLTLTYPYNQSLRMVDRSGISPTFFLGKGVRTQSFIVFLSNQCLRWKATKPCPSSSAQ